MTDPTIYDLFNLLDDWRHLPKYQLERRADLFFALFLPDVLEQHCDTPINPLIIPEFPLKKCANNGSNNVDYFALSADGKRAFFVELKTEMRSVDQSFDKGLKVQSQYKSYKTAAKKGMLRVLCNLKPIFGSIRDEQTIS